MKEKESKKKAAAEERKRSGSFDKAVAEYEKAMRLFHKRSFEEAKSHFESVIEKYGAELEICQLCRTYLRAIEEQLQPKKPRPKTAEDYYLLGQLEHGSGDHKSAIERFEKALDLSPGDERVLYALAAAAARLGGQKQSLDALRSAIQKNPDNRLRAARDEDFDAFDELQEFLQLIQKEEGARA